MPDVTVNVPSVSLEAYFTFKEPINSYLKNKYNLESLKTKLKVISIINMKDMIRNDLRDPYTELYLPSAIPETDYKKDLLDNVPIVSFSFIDNNSIERYIRSPLNYIESYSNISNVEYINKLILIDLNRLPVNLDTTVFYNDLNDFIESRLGVSSVIKEVSVGEIELITQEEHEIRETIRNNTVTVHKTLSTQLNEITIKHDQLLLRLQTLGISLA